MTRTRRLAIRAVFAATLLSLPAMIVVRERVGEPYPGLYQPAFDGITMRGDLFGRDEPRLSVREASGARSTIALTDLVDAPKVDGPQVESILRGIIRDRSRMRSAPVARAVRARLVALGFDDPVRLRVSIYSTTRDATRPGPVQRGALVQTYVVRLDR